MLKQKIAPCVYHTVFFFLSEQIKFRKNYNPAVKWTPHMYQGMGEDLARGFVDDMDAKEGISFIARVS